MFFAAGIIWVALLATILVGGYEYLIHLRDHR